MEHEQVNERAVALAARGAKMTARMLAQMMQAFLRQKQQTDRLPKDKAPQGKQSIRQLTRQGASLSNIEIKDDNIGSFKRTARKYNVDFSLKKDRSVDPPRWIVFFKAKDTDALTAAFNEYSKKIMPLEKAKPTLLQRLARFKEMARTHAAPVRNRDRGGHEL